MFNNNLEALRGSRRSPHVALHQFNSLRSRHPRHMVCVFEGNEDVIFFDSIFRRILVAIEYEPLVVKGKDQVLGLRELVKRSQVHDPGLVRYFVDRDFDGTKGHPNGPDLYVTPTYSIENFLVGRKILLGLLRAEFKCTNGDDDAECQAALALFEKCQVDFKESIADANRLIFYARTKQHELHGIEESIGKYVDIRLSGVEANVDRTTLFGLIRFRENPDWTDVDAIAPDFTQLDPTSNWRGKFWLAYFRKFLTLLKDDRCSATPSVFRQQAKVRFDPNGEIIRSLALLCEIPQCLVTFVQSIGSLAARA